MHNSGGFFRTATRSADTMSTRNIGDQVCNLILTGFGQINRIRQIAPKGARPDGSGDTAEGIDMQNRTTTDSLRNPQSR